MKILNIGILLALTVAASAQQPQQTPAQVALTINGVIGQWAQALEAQQKQIADLQKQIEDLKTKCEAPAK